MENAWLIFYANGTRSFLMPFVHKPSAERQAAILRRQGIACEVRSIIALPAHMPRR